MSQFDTLKEEESTIHKSQQLEEANHKIISILSSVSRVKENSTDQDHKTHQKRNPPIVKGCFIATAAMGSELHPHVQILRDFRDNILLQSRYKDSFENLLNQYYRFSPPIARTMQDHLLIRRFLRYALVYPIVFGIKLILPLVNVILGIETDARRRKSLKSVLRTH